MQQPSFPRTIKSFIRRNRSLKNPEHFNVLWKQYGLTPTNQLLDFDACFTQKGLCILEIGFGNGQSILQQAQNHPDNRYLGIEVYRAGILQLLQQASQQNIQNIKVFEGNAIEILSNHFPDKSLDALHILFPDPWPKKKHHKRRLIQPDFIHLVIQKLKRNAIFYLATDWEPYAHGMLKHLEAFEALENLSGKSQFSERIPTLPLTKFEQRGMDQGRACWYLRFKKA